MGKGITINFNRNFFSIAGISTTMLFWFLFRLLFLFLFRSFLRRWCHAGYYDVIVFGIWRWFTGEKLESIGIFNFWRQCRPDFLRMINVKSIIILKITSRLVIKRQNYPFVRIFLGFQTCHFYSVIFLIQKWLFRGFSFSIPPSFITPTFVLLSQSISILSINHSRLQSCLSKSTLFSV